MNLEQNYFLLLGVEQRYSLGDDDFRSIQQQSRKLQRQYHPDRIGDVTPKEKQLAAQFSALVNSAVQALKDPVLRAIHLLELSGVTNLGEQHTIRDTKLLMEQMMFREELEAAAQSGDSQALNKLQCSVDDAFTQAQQGFAQLFDDYPLATQLPEQNYDAAKSGVAALQFYQKLGSEINHQLAAFS